MDNNTPNAKKLQPCKDISKFHRTFSYIDPTILTALESAMGRPEDPGEPRPGPGRPRISGRSLIRSYLMFKYPGLITRYKMAELKRQLASRSGRIYDALLSCEFASLPSYGTFRRAFDELNRHPDPVEAALRAISEVLQSPPWAAPVQTAEEKKDTAAKINDYVQRQRAVRDSDDEINESIYGMSPEEFAVREARVEKWFRDLWWPNGCPRCPHCQSERIRTIKSKRPTPYRCKDCHSHFSMRTRTAMQDAKLRYVDWLEMMRSLLRIKGTSALQMAYDRGKAPNTTWSVGHKIRHCMREEPCVAQGQLQIDGASLGGREEYKHWHKRLHNRGGSEGKVPLIGILDPAAGKISFMISEEKYSPQLRDRVKEILPDGGLLVTDGHKAYEALIAALRNEGKDIEHLTVNHSSTKGGKYAKWYGNTYVTTNAIESVFREVKAALCGTYVHCDVGYLPLYLQEVAWRHNHRGESDTVQLEALARNMYGRSITVEELRRDAAARRRGNDQRQQLELMEIPADTGENAQGQPQQPRLIKFTPDPGRTSEATVDGPEFGEIPPDGEYCQLSLPLMEVVDTVSSQSAQPPHAAPWELAA